MIIVNFLLGRRQDALFLGVFEDLSHRYHKLRNLGSILLAWRIALSGVYHGQRLFPQHMPKIPCPPLSFGRFRQGRVQKKLFDNVLYIVWRHCRA